MVATLQNEFRKVGFAGYDVPEFVLVYFLGFFAMDQYRTISESVVVITAAHRDSRVPITASSLFRGGPYSFGVTRLLDTHLLHISI